MIINEEFLQEVETLQTLLKNNVAGQFGGNHRSKRYGSSCEYVDFRDYREGDDIARIDWNSYARTEKLYMKLYSDERQMHTKIYIDASRSMAFGNGKKDEQALKIAATLAYISVCEMDRVSIFALKEDKVEDIVTGILGKEAYTGKIGNLNSVNFGGDSKISEAILPAEVGYGDGLSVIISDFLTDNDYESAIDRLVDKRRDVLCIQILSEEELNPKIRGKMHFYDSENSDKTYRKNVNKDIAEAYARALEFVTGRIQNFCSSRGADYMLVSAEESMGEVFFDKFVAGGVIK